MLDLRFIPFVALSVTFVPLTGCGGSGRSDDGAATEGSSGTGASTGAADTVTSTFGTTGFDVGTDPTDTDGPETPDLLELVLLVTPETEAAHDVWVGLFTQAGFSVTTDHSLAGVEPTAAALGELAEQFDVAFVAPDVPASSYASPAWNDLPIGLITLHASSTSAEQWHWLDLVEAQAQPVEDTSEAFTVADAHAVLYGLEVGSGATVQIVEEAAEIGVHGYLRQTQGSTDMGFVALTHASAEVSDDIQQLVLWEPGPFFSEAEHEAAARRAFLGLSAPGSALVPALTDAGRKLLVQTVQWAATPGTPVRTDVEFDPIGLFLTWQSDPTTTMTIDWHTLPAEEDRPSQLRYWADGESSKQMATGDARPFPHSDRTIHRVQVQGLEPDTVYLFDFGDDSPVFRFRTMPESADEPIFFLAGGDVRHSQSMMAGTTGQAMRHSPAFIALGGDLAYANGDPGSVGRWYEWFEVVRTGLVSGEGRVIPILAAPGNHEVQGGYHTNASGYEQTDAWRAEIAPFYYELFAFPGQPGYQVLDFGDYMSFVLLDTHHTNPIPGAQTEWLAQVLEERRQVPHVFPIYHVPAYPSHRSYGGGVSGLVRQHFVPLFEASSVRTAFENHDHLYKRTVPLLEGEESAEGLVFLGDGAWGVSTREPNNEWYLAEVVQIRHFIVATIEGDAQRFRAFDDQGQLFDALTR
jgi:acid phosphatase type 7